VTDEILARRLLGSIVSTILLPMRFSEKEVALKKFILMFLYSCLFVLPTILKAQDRGTLSVFGGYSQPVVNLDRGHGWNASVAGNLTKHFALVADVSGYYSSSDYTTSMISSEDQSSQHIFLFGPRYMYTIKERWTPFAHALFGWDRMAESGRNAFGSTAFEYDRSDNAFAVAFGVGLDYKVNNRFSIRPIQIDGVGLRSGDGWGWGYFIRTSFGAVFYLDGGN